MQTLAGCLPPAPEFALAFYVQTEAQVSLVLKCRDAPATGWLTARLRSSLERVGVETLWLHMHPAAGKRMFSNHGWLRLFGPTLSRDRHGLLYGPSSFRQASPELYERALDRAEQFLQPDPTCQVLDLYCGVGQSLARWRARGAPVAGVELAGEACDCARLNVPGAVVLRGKAKHRIPQLQQWLRDDATRLLFVNPPRTGLALEVTDWIGCHCRPLRMAYLSCSAGTLHRDLEQLERYGYTVTRLRPYDFFPQTRHVETLALLSYTATES